ncbi:MAG: HAD hydrolase-like protein [Bacteroidota bacterium]
MKTIYPTSLPQAIFFDFDGVILESGDIKTDAFVELFDHLDTETKKTIKQHHMDNMGVSRFKKFEWIYKNLLDRDITEAELKSLGDHFSDIVFKKVLACPAVSGAEQLLEWAKHNTLSFVASGTPEKELREIVEKRNLTHYFDDVKGSPATKTQIVNEKLAKHKLDKHNCWFVGDANTDYLASVETDLNFIARLTPDMNDFWKNKNVWKVDDMIEVFEKFSVLNGK